MHARISRRVEAYGPRPECDGESALENLLRSKDLYSAAPTPVRPYEPHKFKVLSSGIVATPLRDRLPPDGRIMMDQANTLICRPQPEVDRMIESGEITPVYPYWDVVLRRSRRKRLDLFRRLMDAGLVGLRQRIRARAGIFFVTKKDGSLRMVVDGREPSSFHRRPPHTGLGSAAAISTLDLSPAALDVTHPPGHPRAVHGASADLKQGFYQLTWPEMGSWFGFDYPEPLHEFGVNQIFDETSGGMITLPGDTMVFPVFEGLAMGWSWSLHFCNMVTSDCLRVGIGRALGVPAQQVPVLAEHLPVPLLQPDMVATASYVDNGNIIGTSSSLVARALAGFLDELTRRNLEFHEVEHPTQHFISGGVEFFFDTGICRHKTSRAWRLYQSLEHLLRLGGCTGLSLRVVLGHLVCHFMLCRPALSCLDLTYRFVARNLHKFARFSQAERAELLVAKGLVFLCQTDMAKPWSALAYCTDACMSGWAMLEAALPLDEIMEAGRVKERWRFRPGDPVDPVDLIADADVGWSSGISADFARDRALLLEAAPPVRQREVLDSRPPRRLIGNTLAGIAPLSDSILSPSKWRLVLRGGFWYAEAIHMLEGRTTLLPLKRASRSTALHGHKFLTIGDNMSSLLSFERGRARDWGLRQLTRVSAARSIACELDQRHRYSETDRNPSDRDSRAAERGEVRPGQVQSGPRRELQLLMDIAVASMTSATVPMTQDHLRRPSGLKVTDAPAVRRAVAPAGCPATTSTSSSTSSPSRPPRTAPTHFASSAPLAAHGPSSTTSPTRSRTQPRPRAVLELYAGCARLSGACLQLGLETACPVELGKGPWHDLHNREILKLVRRWIVQRQVWFVHFGTPCTHWSVSTPSDSRGRHAPAGLTAARKTLSLIKLCRRYHVRWSIENPQSSRLWSWPPLQQYLASIPSSRVLIHYCQYGCRYQKPTLLLTDLEELTSLAATCKGGHMHEHLQGTVRLQSGPDAGRRFWKTTLAGKYPPELCRRWAQVLGATAPRSAWSHAAPRHAVHPHWENEMALVTKHVLSKRTPDPSCPAGSPAEWTLDEVTWDPAGQTAALRLDAARRASAAGPTAALAAPSDRASTTSARRTVYPRRALPPPTTREAPDTSHLLPGRNRARALRVRQGLQPPRSAEPRQSRDPLPQPPVLQRRGRLRRPDGALRSRLQAGAEPARPLRAAAFSRISARLRASRSREAA